MIRRFKKCLITGITGSGGSYLCEHIVSKKSNIKIYGTYRSSGYLKLLKKKCKNKIKFFKVDLTSFTKIKKIINLVKPDLIYHIASNADVRGSFDKPKEIIDNNNSITLNLLEAVRTLKLKPLIVICSSSEVYGNVKKEDIPIKENKCIAPVNPYAASKAFQDIISQVYYKCYGLKIIITRMFSYTNARRKNLFQTTFANQIVEIEKGKKQILRHGNLKSIRCMIDISDAMEAYWLTAQKGRVGKIYNIGGNKSISVVNYLKELIKLSKAKIVTKIDKKLMRPTDVTLQIADANIFKSDVKWIQKVKFKDSVKKLLNDCRSKM
jgi:GDPmannose 4,6-dehydratase/GDP-4-dehydro-6-deoxy-D-mannose reductase